MEKKIRAVAIAAPKRENIGTASDTRRGRCHSRGRMAPAWKAWSSKVACARSVPPRAHAVVACSATLARRSRRACMRCCAARALQRRAPELGVRVESRATSEAVLNQLHVAESAAEHERAAASHQPPSMSARSRPPATVMDAISTVATRPLCPPWLPFPQWLRRSIRSTRLPGKSDRYSTFIAW